MFEKISQINKINVERGAFTTHRKFKETLLSFLVFKENLNEDVDSEALILEEDATKICYVKFVTNLA